jgi:hypothetical protein
LMTIFCWANVVAVLANRASTSMMDLNMANLLTTRRA